MSESFETLLERVRRVAGSDALEGLDEIDPSNDLHVDRAAAALLDRLQQSHDAEAYRLLVELTAGRLSAIAEDIARDLGLGDDPDELVVDFYTRLLTDLRPVPTRSLHFLGRAADRLRQDAEAHIRDVALSDGTDASMPATWEDLVTGETLDPEEERRDRMTRVCFHRLDVPYRRALRARDIEDLDLPAVAERLGLDVGQTEALLAEAEERLAEAVDRAVGESPP